MNNEYSMKGPKLPENEAFYQKVKKEYEENLATDKERREAMIASAKDPEKQAEFAAARIVRVYLNVLADSRALELFEYTALADDELPVLISETDQSYNVLEIQQAGLTPADNFVNKDTVNNYLMYPIDSDRIDYPTRSIQTGQLNVSDRVNKRMSYALNRKINKDIWTLIDAAFGSYPSGTYERDADIVSATLPTTNAIDETAEGALTFDVFKKTAEHANLLGKRIRSIYMNPTERSDMWDWEHLASTAGSLGTQDSRKLITDRMKDIILSNGELASMLGHDFEIVLDNTRAKKYLWVFMDGPAGIFFDKPGFAETIFYSEKELEILAKKEYQEGVKARRVIKPLIPAPYRTNFARVQFVT